MHDNIEMIKVEYFEYTYTMYWGNYATAQKKIGKQYYFLIWFFHRRMIKRIHVSKLSVQLVSKW